jgi:hypothetical protein
VLCLVMYSSFYTPYQTAFYKQNPDSFWFDTLVDLAFAFDIILTFYSGYDKGYDVIMDKKRIAKHYLKTWFFIDFIATVPWSILVAWVDSVLAQSDMVSMLRLLKVFRLARAGRIIKRITQTMTIHTKFIDAVNFFIYVMIVCHLLACFFYILPRVVSCQIDQAAADAAFLEPHSSTVGWSMDGDGPGNADGLSCMQGSWRQVSVYTTAHGAQSCRQGLTGMALWDRTTG